MYNYVQTTTSKLCKNEIVLILSILVVAIVIRLTDITSKTLWYDELQSVTHAFLPIEDLLQSVQKFDPHPPLYYIQLHIWMLFGVSTLWLKINSILWSILTIFSLFIVVKNVFNKRVSTIASFLLCISPFSVVYAQEVRMYSMLMFLGVWIFFFSHHLLYRKKCILTSVGLVITTLSFLYSHGAGFMILFSTTSYAMIYVFDVKENMWVKWKQFVRWVVLHILILALYSPWLYNARNINVGHTLKPDLEDIVNTLSILLLGFGPFPNWIHWAGVVLTVVIFVVLLIYDKKSRGLVISFVLVPIISCVLISFLIRPIWLYRTLAYITPFLCLTLALATTNTFDTCSKCRANPLLSYGVFGFVGMVLLFSLINQQLNISYP